MTSPTPAPKKIPRSPAGVLGRRVPKDDDHISEIRALKCEVRRLKHRLAIAEREKYYGSENTDSAEPGFNDKRHSSPKEAEMSSLSQGKPCVNFVAGSAAQPDCGEFGEVLATSAENSRGESELQIIALEKEKADLVAQFEAEKNEMIDNFEVTTGVLLERIRTLESSLDESRQAVLRTSCNAIGNMKHDTASTRPGTAFSSERGSSSYINITDQHHLMSRPGTAAICLQDALDAAAHQQNNTSSNNMLSNKMSGLLISDDEDTTSSEEDSTKVNNNKDILILDRGEEVDRQFLQAARDGKIDLLEEMRSQYAIPLDDVVCPDSGDSLLHACIQAKKEIQQDILSFALGYGAEVDVVNKAGLTPLHQAIQNNSLSMVKALVELGADFNLPIADESRYTPVMLTCTDEKLLRICKFLVESKADLNRPSSTFGAAPMEIAQKNKAFQTMVYLASSGASLRGPAR